MNGAGHRAKDKNMNMKLLTVSLSGGACESKLAGSQLNWHHTH